jgi:hypothetical protein
VRSGDEVEGWRVGQIGLRSVALEHEGHIEFLSLAGPQPMPGATQAEEGPKQESNVGDEHPRIGALPPFVSMRPDDLPRTPQKGR